MNFFDDFSQAVLKLPIRIVITAAQPSHDWAAGDPQTDFTAPRAGEGSPILRKEIRHRAGIPNIDVVMFVMGDFADKLISDFSG